MEKLKTFIFDCLIDPSITDENLSVLPEKIIASFEDQKAIIKESNKPERVSLGYPIKRKKEAYLLTIKLELDGKNIKEIDKDLKEKDRLGVLAGSPNMIFRYLFTIKPEIKEKLVRPRPPVVESEETKEQPSKVELKEIDKKIEEILGE